MSAVIERVAAYQGWPLRGFHYSRGLKLQTVPAQLVLHEFPPLWELLRLSVFLTSLGR